MASLSILLAHIITLLLLLWILFTQQNSSEEKSLIHRKQNKRKKNRRPAVAGILIFTQTDKDELQNFLSKTGNTSVLKRKRLEKSNYRGILMNPKDNFTTMLYVVIYWLKWWLTMRSRGKERPISLYTRLTAAIDCSSHDTLYQSPCKIS